uniref:Uncharacterized protein n=1 Tax=Panstrongylus lignarius TaxID=156445 RepID=A0A224XVE4_9HEMI
MVSLFKLIIYWQNLVFAFRVYVSIVVGCVVVVLLSMCRISLVRVHFESKTIKGIKSIMPVVKDTTDFKLNRDGPNLEIIGLSFRRTQKSHF